MKIKTIAIGCDHAGFPYKHKIIRLLEKRGIKVLNFGTDSLDSVDYPDFVHPVAQKVSTGDAELGIVLCGSGNGVAITANKYQDIRCVLAWKVALAELGRAHNNANMLSIPTRFISQKMALNIVDAFLDTKFEGGRHKRRVNKIAHC